MIDKLRRKMIWISCGALVLVFFLIFSVLFAVSTRQLNDTMDILCDRISAGGGSFLPFDKNQPRPPDMDRFSDYFTAETPFSTRYFVLHFDSRGSLVRANIESVSSVTGEDVGDYAAVVQNTRNMRGWQGNYRYAIYDTAQGQMAVFVDGSVNRATTRSMLIITGAVMVASVGVILCIIILLSKRAVQPIAAGYEKQKQFVTDANHELKTPLTLILTNLDILESEIGESEWLEDIRTESRHMSSLVNQLTSLSRMDEDQPNLQLVSFPLSEMVEDTMAEFLPLAQERGLTVRGRVQPGLQYVGDEGSLRQVLAILLDNAVKYCDPAGSISLYLTMKRYPVITVENAYREVDHVELDRLFDRFYRADKARTSSGSFGIGLSIAQAIVQQHRGEISAYKAGPGRIGFRIQLK